MLLNSKISLDLFNAWSADQKHPHRDRADRFIPTVQDFEVFLDVLFQASLLQEEGVPISTSVAWVSKEHFQKYELPMRRETELCLCFDSPIYFEARTLAKMSGIANGYSSTLLAHGTRNNIHIWGICYFDPVIKAIGAITAQPTVTRHFSPDCPTITISGIGSLQITRGDSIIGRVENGKFLPSHADVLSLDMLGKYLYRLLGIEIDFETRRLKDKNELDIADKFIPCIEYLIEILSQRKLGSTIIFVPENNDVKSHFDCSWSASGSLEIDILQENKIKLTKTKDPLLESLSVNKISSVLHNRLRNLADLAKMDGALLLTPKFEVVGFGAKLKPSKWKGETQHGPAPYIATDQKLDFSRLGTRHNSALDFVGQVGGAIAFVSSSDGPIRALTKDDDGRVVYWPDCRISMFK